MFKVLILVMKNMKVMKNIQMKLYSKYIKILKSLEIDFYFLKKYISMIYCIYFFIYIFKKICKQ